MAEKVQKYILMNDRVGEHVEKGWITSINVPTQLLRGEIFEALPESDQPEDPDKIALKVIYTSDSNIKLECLTLDVVKLSDSEADLLAAVSNLEERFRIFRERNVAPRKTLDVGTTVLVKLKNGVKEYKGVIWYKGPLPTHKGTMFGVELLDKEAEGQGTSNGTFANKRYFDCPQDFGVFVAVDRLRPHQDTAWSPKKEPGIISKIRDYFIPSCTDSYSHNKLVAQDHQLKIDQRVVVYINDDHPCRGTVRYISEKCDSNGDRPIGIELDKRMGTGTGVFEGKQRFICKRDHAVFYPVSGVIPEEYIDASNSDTVRSSSDRLAKSGSLSGSLGYEVNAKKPGKEEIKRSNSATSISSQLSEEALVGQNPVITEKFIKQQKDDIKTQQKSKVENEIDWVTETVAGMKDADEAMALDDEEKRKEKIKKSPKSNSVPPVSSTTGHSKLCISNDEEKEHQESGLKDLKGHKSSQPEQQNRTEMREKKSDRDSKQYEMYLAEKRNVRQALEKFLQISEQRAQELETSLSQERQAHEETGKRLQSSEQRSQQLETSLSQERQAHQETEKRLQSSEQRSQQLETSLSQERQAHKETEKHLQISEQRSDRLEASLLEESRRSNELETTMATVRQALEKCRNSRNIAERDWVLFRKDIVLSDHTIGIGAWATVKEGTFRGSKVAVKEIHQLILSPHNRRLFEREMSIASRCRHPCLLQFIGATYDDQSPLFVTELLDTSLRAVLHERALQPTEITTIALDVAKGLNYLHLNQPTPIIHRDISSANVLLWKHDTSWRAKVSDYGTANILQQSMTASPGAVIYSAPEAQTTRQSPKVDVYSFGVLLCEMNVREMPDAQHREEQVAMVTNNFFRNVIRRCLQQNPEERPSMAEIIDVLQNSP